MTVFASMWGTPIGRTPTLEMHNQEGMGVRLHSQMTRMADSRAAAVRPSRQDMEHATGGIGVERPATLPCGTCSELTDGSGTWRHQYRIGGPHEWSFWCERCAPSVQRQWDYEELFRQVGDSPWTVSPDEWMGRHSHELVFAGALALDWDDPAVDAWCKRVMELSGDLSERDRLQRLYLTEDDYRAAKRHIPIS